MEINDIIRQKMVMEVDGVVVTNTFYYLIKDNTLATTVGALAVQIHADWWDRIKGVMSVAAATVCSTWENLMGNGPSFAAFQTIIGVVVTDNMSPDNTVIVTRKAVRSDAKIATGSLQISGVTLLNQNDGHMNDYEIALGMESWLTTDQIYGPTVIRNMQPSTVATVKEYNEVVVAQTNGHVKKKLARRSYLCKSLS